MFLCLETLSLVFEHFPFVTKCKLVLITAVCDHGSYSGGIYFWMMRLFEASHSKMEKLIIMLSSTETKTLSRLKYLYIYIYIAL